MNNLAVIPARGGSQGIPHKNVAIVAGKPLIVWTIEAALRVQSLDRVLVSTDDPLIAEISKEAGASVPFLRPAAMAADDTPGIQPVIHATHWVEKHHDCSLDNILTLQPTSPLRTSDDIANALSLAERTRADSVVSVCRTNHHPYLAKKITPDGRIVDFVSANESFSRRQDLPPVYTLNGAVYIATRSTLLRKRTWFTNRTYAYVMPSERSIDIDEPWDLYLADLILRNREAPQ